MPSSCFLKNKQYSVSEAFKILHAKGIALENLNFVVASLCKSVRIWAKERICNRFEPIAVSFSVFLKGFFLIFDGIKIFEKIF